MGGQYWGQWIWWRLKQIDCPKSNAHLQPTASSNEFSSAYVLKCDDEDDDVWVVPPGGIASYLTHSLAMEIGSVNLSHLSNEQ